MVVSFTQQKRHTASLIPFYKKKEEVCVLLQKRSADAERLPGLFGFFGGGVEIGESPEQALVREILEELTIEITSYTFLGHYEFYGRIADVYYMEVPENFLDTVQVQEGEYGQFFTEQETLDEQKIILPDKVILKNFFGLTKRNDPFS
jgi:mutator protein MutT